MARYHVIKPETGETQVVECSVHDIMDWYEANPGWERDWSHGAAMVTSEVGEWKDRLGNKHNGWKHIIDKASKAPGSRVDKL